MIKTQPLNNLYPKSSRTRFYLKLETLCESIYEMKES